jgi:hypothetical protein
MAEPLKALIIGAGSIGGLIDSPDAKAIASHAHAYHLHPRTRIAAICEPGELNVFAFMERWGESRRYASIDEIGGDETFDIVSIASPTTEHFCHLSTLLKRSDCRYILCEKPLVASAEEFHAIATLVEHSNKKILIHLMRRYNRAFIALSERIHAREFGNLIGFHGVCTKGLLHNGSHLLGVLSHFIGPIKSIKPLGTSPCQGDVCGEFGISCDAAPGTVSVLSHPEYSLFELTLWFDKGVIKLLEGGEIIEIHSKIPSPLYEGYFTLAPSETIATGLSRYALDSLEFLLGQSDEQCHDILREHLHLHKLIYETIAKAYDS